MKNWPDVSLEYGAECLLASGQDQAISRISSKISNRDDPIFAYGMYPFDAKRKQTRPVIKTIEIWGNENTILLWLFKVAQFN